MSSSLICMDFVFTIEISMSASSRDPFAIAETLAVAISMLESSSAASSAYPRVCTLTLPKSTPLCWNLSCLRRISSRARMKYSGDVMSPWTTPRLMGNASEKICLPFVPWTFVFAVAAAYIALKIDLHLLEAFASASALSRNRWLTESNAAE